MAKYIECEKVVELFNKWADGYSYIEVPTKDAIACVRAIPAADVRPAVRGYIEEDENTYLFCSECNCNITLAAYETPDNRLVLRPNFCPNCGAMMEES